MKKTFLEIVNTIKEGEVWVNRNQRVSKVYINKSGNLHFEGCDINFSQNYSTCVSLDSEYELERNEYSFEEAFKAYEEGKEIESIGNKYRYRKIEGKDMIYNTFYKKMFEHTEGIDIDEIRDKWYIND